MKIKDFIKNSINTICAKYINENNKFLEDNLNNIIDKLYKKYKEKFDCVWHLRCDCYCDRTDHYQFCCQSYQSGGKFHGIYFGKR